MSAGKTPSADVILPEKLCDELDLEQESSLLKPPTNVEVSEGSEGAKVFSGIGWGILSPLANEAAEKSRPELSDFEFQQLLSLGEALFPNNGEVPVFVSDDLYEKIPGENPTGRLYRPGERPYYGKIRTADELAAILEPIENDTYLGGEEDIWMDLIENNLEGNRFLTPVQTHPQQGLRNNRLLAFVYDDDHSVLENISRVGEVLAEDLTQNLQRDLRGNNYSAEESSSSYDGEDDYWEGDPEASTIMPRLVELGEEEEGDYLVKYYLEEEAEVNLQGEELRIETEERQKTFTGEEFRDADVIESIYNNKVGEIRITTEKNY